MNKTKIEWCDYTWNPVTGCRHDCWYCYVKRIRNYDRTPQLHEGRLHRPFSLKKPSRIFICSTADLFGEWVPAEWIKEILKVIQLADWHTYLFLTKNPARLKDFKFGPNVWLGTSVDDQGSIQRIYDLTLSKHNNLFISFEPMLMSLDIPDFLLAPIRWLIFGALTGPQRSQYPVHQAWLEQVLCKTDKLGIPVFMKDNLRAYLSCALRREFPEYPGQSPSITRIKKQGEFF